MNFSVPSEGAQLAGRYALERVLGEGASSVVFAARDLRLDRMVAVKVLKPQAVLGAGPQRSRFMAEARTLARLAHPQVVAIHDVGEAEAGTAFFVMELISDSTLDHEIEARGTLRAHEVLEILIPLMGALACAHDRGIVHRDLKPANIVLERSAHGQPNAKLLDFGIAKLELGNTSSGVALGTPAYMAPEQATSGTVGPYTDVWAMGVLLFRCLSGRVPFDAPTPTGMLLKIVHERAPRLREVCPSATMHVAIAIDRALEPSLNARYPDMRQFARSLAIACRQDGIELSSEPDPLGLPKFAEWLASADLEVTGAAEPVAAPVPAAPTVASPVPKSHRHSWAIGLIGTIGTVLTILALNAMSDSARATAVVHKSNLTTAEATRSSTPPRAVGSLAIPQAAVPTPTSQLTRAPTTAPSPEPTPTPVAEPARTRRRETRARGVAPAARALPDAPVTTEQAPAPVAAEPKKPAIRAQWDW